MKDNFLFHNSKITPFVWERFVLRINRIWVELNERGIKKVDSILVAISGGPDSMLMSYLLYKYLLSREIKIILCYVNHSVRTKKEIEEEISLIRSFAGKVNAELVVRKIKTTRCDENSLRKKRYEKLYEVASEYSCRLIATGHNRDDSVETFLINLFRGSGVAGLTGISYFREVNFGNRKLYVIRPLIDIGKEEVVNEIKKVGIPFSVDSTNLSSKYTRNILRNEILPQIRKIFPSYDNHIVNTMEILCDVYRYLEEEMEKVFCEVVKRVDEKNIHLDFKKFLIYNRVIQKEILCKILDDLFNSKKRDVFLLHSKIIKLLMKFFADKREVVSVNKYLSVRKKNKTVVFTLKK